MRVKVEIKESILRQKKLVDMVPTKLEVKRKRIKKSEKNTGFFRQRRETTKKTGI